MGTLVSDLSFIRNGKIFDCVIIVFADRTSASGIIRMNTFRNDLLVNFLIEALIIYFQIAWWLLVSDIMNCTLHRL